MSELPPSSKYLQRADLPVDEVEREALTKRLSDAYADGRMGQADYLAALDVVYGASRLGDLVPVVERLPAAATEVPAIVGTGAAPAGELVPSRGGLALGFVAIAGILSLLLVLAVVVGLFILF